MQEITPSPQAPGHSTKTLFLNKQKPVFAEPSATRLSQFGETMKTPISFSPRTLHYYMAACKWMADMDFYRKESRFFRLLVEKYTHSAVDAGQLGQLDHALHQLAKRALKIDALKKTLAGHLQQLTLIGEKKATEDPEWLADAHISFERLINAFAQDYRNEKLALFNLIEEFSI